MNDLQVLVVADDPLARAGLSTMLADQPRCKVVGTDAGGSDLPAQLEIYQPDVIVWDLGWDAALALDLLRDLEETPTSVVALLSDETYTSEVWASGVRGLLLRDAGADSLLAAVTAVSHGMAVLDPDLASAVMPARSPLPAPPFQDLTPRELGVLQVLAEGLTNKAIAHRLDISEHTVKFHVNSILTKLSAQSRTEAVIQATRLGLVFL